MERPGVTRFWKIPPPALRCLLSQEVLEGMVVVAQEQKTAPRLLADTQEEEQVGTPYIQQMEGLGGLAHLGEGVGLAEEQPATARALLEILGMGMGLVVVVVVELTQPQRQHRALLAVTALPVSL